jgi:hypothetical protein
MHTSLLRHSWLALFLFAAAVQATAAIVILSPVGSGDAGVYRDWWSGSYYGVFGAADATVGFQYDGSMKYWSVPVFHFPLTGLTPAAVESATLSLYLTDHGGNTQLRYYGSGAGTVGTADYINTGSSLGYTAWTGAGWYSWDVTASLQDAVSNAYTHAVFFMRPDNYSGASVMMSESGEYSPRIEVVPEPGATALLAGLLVLAVGMLHRRRAP